MPRTGPTSNRRKHLVIIFIALIIALIVLLIRADTASASLTDAPTPESPLISLQITGEDYQRAVTTERLMILGMLALVVATWFYLKWRPAPGYGDEDDQEDQLEEGEDRG
jgi:hypothetical protein